MEQKHKINPVEQEFWRGWNTVLWPFLNMFKAPSAS